MVTAAEIARLLGMSGAWVRRHAEQGTIPARKLGGVWRFKASEVLAWADQQRTGPDDELPDPTDQQ
jgi:excisionase family DNA binding protein